MERRILKKRKCYKQLEFDSWCIEKGQILVRIKMPDYQDLLGDVSKHKIEENGEVNPSVLITGSDDQGELLTYHGYVTLEGWDNKKSI